MNGASLHFLRLGQFRAIDNLRARQHRNFDRLEEEKYRPENVFQREKEAGNWPGDTEGRTVLALVLLAQATGRTPQYLDAILARWPGEVNARGYFGDIQPDGLISEQQLSGHGWVLRALAELERWRPGGPARALATPVIENLILPTAGQHRLYPLDPAVRRPEGGFSGTHLGRVGPWLLSTDVGCDFICLDGVVDAYDVFRDERLRPLAEEMIDRFLELDLLAVQAQTHATLTACRALLRWAEIAGRAELVRAVAQRFDLYTAQAWTEHHANYNWFGRPEWTEPCAIVDSLMVAMELWRWTREDRYLTQAQQIYFNALGHAQRANGGFGCDNCPGADGEDDLFHKVYEAHWCCTMRGGEGLARVGQYNIAREGDAWLVTFGLGGAAVSEVDRIAVVSEYPNEPRLQVIWEANAQREIARVRVYIPAWFRVAGATDAAGNSVVLGRDQRWLELPLTKAEGTWSITGEFVEGTRATLHPLPGGKHRVVRYRGPLLHADRPDGPGVEPLFAAFAAEPVAKPRRRLLVPEV